MKFQDMCLYHLNDVIDIENSTYNIPWTNKQFNEMIIDDNYKKTIVTIDNEIVAYIILFQNKDGWSIENLTVKIDFRKRGIGELLVFLATLIAKGEPITAFVSDRYLGMHMLLQKNKFIAVDVNKDDDGDDFYVFMLNNDYQQIHQ